MRIRVLGEVGAVGPDGVELALGAPQQRRLLAALVLHHGQACPMAWLEHALWPDDEAQPANPADAVRTYVARLRSVLGRDAIVTGDGSYQLHLPDAEVDVVRFDQLVDEAMRTGPRLLRLELLGEALGLWQGEPYGAFADEDAFRIEHRRLSETRVAALESMLGARLELGEHRALLPQLEALAREQPLRETPHRLWMLALYRSGAQAEALRVFHDHRRMLGEELGLEPSSALIELEQQIAARDPSLDPTPMGRRLREYQLGRQIGQGSVGTVHEALQPSLGRTVAVKAIRKELADRPEFMRQFDVEAHMIARLEHPNIVPLYDYWRDPSGAYLVMRHLAGGSLADRLRIAPPRLDDLIGWVGQIAHALDAAHRSGVIHRDIRPSNILFDLDDNAYLADFGIAVLEDAVSGEVRASSGRTVVYRSPEAVRHEAVGPAADIHALGVVVFEALTGTSPFAGPSDEHVERSVLSDPLPPVAAVRADVPAGVDAVLARATSKDPAIRHETAGEFAIELRAGLAGTVVSAASSASPSPNPYRGLLPFDEVDAIHFHGRKRLVDEVLHQLRDVPPTVVCVVGPSGAGKSSLVRAGVVPALRSDAIPGSAGWLVATMTPGESPFEALATALERVAVSQPRLYLGRSTESIGDALRSALPEGAPLLLVVDQFEELFTMCRDTGERDRFLAALREAACSTDMPLRVLLTLRADFYDRPLGHGSIADLVTRQLVSMTPPTAEELQQMVVDPAVAAGVDVEPALLARLVADVVHQPSGLPLLEYALTELFERRNGAVLTLADYETLGGITGALPRRAEALWREVSEGEREAVRLIFARLVNPGDGGDTRRRARRSELGGDSATVAALDAFERARLLSFDRDPATREPTVDIAHEALLHEWPRLRGWIDEERADLSVLVHLHASAAEWADAGRPDHELFRGGRLESAEALLAGDHVALTEQEVGFIDASIGLREAEAAAARRQSRRLRRRLVSVGVFAIVAVLAGGLAFWQQRIAEAERYDAETRRLASTAVSLAATNNRAALNLAVAAYQRHASPETLGALQQVLLAVPPQPTATLQAERSYLDVVWLPDGRLVGLRVDGLDLIDPETDTVVDHDDFAVNPSTLVAFPLASLERSADGSTLAVVTGDGELRVYPIGEGRGLGAAALRELDFPAAKIALSADGGVVVVGDIAARVSAWTASGAPMFSPIDLADDETLWAQALRLGLESAGDQVTEFFLGQVPVVAKVSIVDEVIWASAGAELTRFDLNGTELDSAIGVFSNGDLTDGLGVINAVYPAEAGMVALRGRGFVDLPVADGLPARIQMPAYDTPGVTQALPVEMIPVRDKLVVLGGDAGSGSDLHVLTRSDRDLEQTVELGLSRASGMAIDATGAAVAVAHANGITLHHLEPTVPLRRSAIRPPGLGRLSIGPRGELVALDQGSQTTLWRSSDDGTVASIDLSIAETLVSSAIIRPGSAVLEVQGTTAGEFVVGGYDAVTGARVAEGRSGAAFVLDTTASAIGELWAAAPPIDKEVSFTHPDGTEERIAEDSIMIYGRSGGGVAGPGEAHHLLLALDPPPEGPDGCSCITTLEFDPAGERLLAATRDGNATLYEVVRGSLEWPRLLEESLATQDIVSGYWSPDGTLVATLSSTGEIAIRHADTFEPIRAMSGGSSSSSVADGVLVFSYDASLLISIVGSSARMWDVASGQQIGISFPNPPAVIPGANTGPAGLQLVTGSDDEVFVWNLDVDSWADMACEAAASNLTEAEWGQWGPRDRSRYRICSDHPVG